MLIREAEINFYPKQLTTQMSNSSIFINTAHSSPKKLKYEDNFGFQRMVILWSCPRKVGQGRKTAGGGRKKLDMKDITGLPSAAILTWGKIA